MTARAKPKEPRFSRETAEVRQRMLVEAARACLARGGIAAFTVENITREANVSRGLLNHHFASKDDLLVAVYQASLYESFSTPGAAPGAAGEPGVTLLDLIGRNFESHYFSRDNLLIWLSLWGEIANNPKLRAAHRKLYKQYRDRIAELISAVAAKRGKSVDATALARNVIALIDGLWLEWCLDPAVLNPDDARAAALGLIESQTGPLAG